VSHPGLFLSSLPALSLLCLISFLHVVFFRASLPVCQLSPQLKSELEQRQLAAAAATAPVKLNRQAKVVSSHRTSSTTPMKKATVHQESTFSSMASSHQHQILMANIIVGHQECFEPLDGR
jgi:hypothetical protein